MKDEDTVASTTQPPASARRGEALLRVHDIGKTIAGRSNCEGLLDAHTSAAGRAVRVYQIAQDFPELLSSRLTLSHVLAVLPLEDTAQIRLLRDAHREGWTVRQVRTAAVDMSVSGRSTGRPRTPPIFKTLTRVLANDDAFEGAEQLLALDHSTAARLLRVCRNAISQLGIVENHLRHAATERPRRRVLVVDSTKAFALRARQILRRHGCAVRVASTCAEALERLDAITGCAIIDLVLPDGEGIELSEQLRQKKPDIRCIYVTDMSPSALPVNARNVSPLVHKASGLLPLKAELTKALAGSSSR